MSDEHPKNQGEGDRESARRYNKDTEQFVESGKVDEAAERARQESGPEDEQAEEEGLGRAHEADPAVHREYDKPTKPD